MAVGKNDIPVFEETEPIGNAIPSFEETEPIEELVKKKDLVKPISTAMDLLPPVIGMAAERSQLPSDSSTSELETSKSVFVNPKLEMPIAALPATKEQPKSPIVSKGDIINQHMKQQKMAVENDWAETEGAYEDLKQKSAPFMEILNNPVAPQLQKQQAQEELSKMAPEMQQVQQKKDSYQQSYKQYLSNTDKAVQQLKDISAHDATYVGGTGRSLAEGTASILESMQGANNLLSKYLFGHEVEGKGGYVQLADLTKESAVNNLNEMPEGFAGKVLGGVAETIPLLLATPFAPELGVIPKFGTAMGAIGFGKSYNEHKDVLAATQEFGYGLAEGSILHGLGMAGESIGKWASTTKAGEIIGKDLTGKSAAAIVSSLGFGVYDASKQFLQTGKVNLDDVAVSIGIGGAFSLSGLARVTYERAFTKTITAPPQLVSDAISIPKTAIELRSEAIKVLEDAVGKSPEEKAKAFYVSGKLNDVLDLKVLGEDIANNPSKHIIDINNSNWSPKEKEAAIANINAIVEANNINIKEAVPLKQEKANLESEYDAASAISDPDFRDSELNRIKEEIKIKKEEIEKVLNKPIIKTNESESNKEASQKSSEESGKEGNGKEALLNTGEAIGAKEVATVEEITPSASDAGGVLTPEQEQARGYIHSLPESEMIKLADELKKIDPIHLDKQSKIDFEKNTGKEISDEEWKNITRNKEYILHDIEATINEPSKIKTNAIQEPSATEILQREPQEAGIPGGERPGVEPVEQGQEVAEKSKEEKVKELQQLSDEDYIKAFIDSGQLNAIGQIESRVDFGDKMPPSEVNKALKDIADGKETAAVRKLKEAIIQTKGSGKIPFIQGVGGTTERINVDLDLAHEDIVAAHKKANPDYEYVPKPPEPTSSMKAGIKTFNKDKGLKELDKQAAKEIGSDWEDAKEAVESDPVKSRQVADKILSGETGATAKQKLQFGYELMKAEKAFDKSHADLKNVPEGIVDDLLQDQADFADANLRYWQEVNDKVQSEWGRLGRYSQELINRDRSLVRMKINLDRAEKFDKNSKEAIAAREELDKAHAAYEKLKTKSDELEKTQKGALIKINSQEAKIIEQTEQNKALRAKAIRLESQINEVNVKAKRASAKKQIDESWSNIKKIWNEELVVGGNKITKQGSSLSLDQIQRMTPEIVKLFEASLILGKANIADVIDKMIKGFKKEGIDITHQEISDVLGLKLDMKKELSDLKNLKIDELQAKTQKSIERSIDNLQKQLSRNDIPEPKKENKVVMTEDLKRLKEIQKGLKKQVKIKNDIEFEKEQAFKKVEGVIEERQKENRTKAEKYAEVARNVVSGIMRPVMTSVDLSVMGTQLAMMSAGNMRKIPGSVDRMLKNAFSEKAADRFMYDIKTSPIYKYIKNSELFLSDAKHTEEVFELNIVEKIPVVGQIIKGSSRAWSGYANKMRVEVFASRVNKLLSDGKTLEKNLEDFKAEAKAINAMTGRGNLGGLEKSAKTLNTVLFSARNISSQFQILGLSDAAMGVVLKNGFYGNLTPSARKLVVKNLASFVGTGLAAIALLDLNDDVEVEYDPRSSDFLKVKVGHTRISIFGGYQTMAVAAIKALTFHAKNTQTGKIEFKSPIETAGKFFRYKESPEVSLIHDWYAGQGVKKDISNTKNAIGQEMYLGEALLNRITPMTESSIYEIYKDSGAKKAIGLAPLAIAGFGINTYGGKKKKK